VARTTAPVHAVSVKPKIPIVRLITSAPRLAREKAIPATATRPSLRAIRATAITAETITLAMNQGPIRGMPR
jgi:hypothetical protein